MEKELLTIVVPAYNVGKYIEQCLNSLVNQTIQNHKVIIVDDGSTDVKTAEISKKYAELYPDIISYLRQENKGLGAARNTGLAQTQTRYIGFLDSDDWLTPDYIEVISKELNDFESENIDIIFTLPIIYDSLTFQDNEWYDKRLFYDVFFSDNRIVSSSYDKRLFLLEPNACRRIYRTDFLREYKFTFPIGVKWEDILPHFYLLYYAKACIGIDSVGFHYRTNTTGQITAQAGQGRLDIVSVFQSVFAFASTVNCEWDIIEIMINMLNRYAKWSLDMSNIDIRPELVKRLSVLYKTLPRQYWKRYFRTRKKYKKERLFVKILLSKYPQLLNDYLPAEISMLTVNRLLRRV